MNRLNYKLINIKELNKVINKIWQQNKLSNK